MRHRSLDSMVNQPADQHDEAPQAACQKLDGETLGQLIERKRRLAAEKLQKRREGV